MRKILTIESPLIKQVGALADRAGVRAFVVGGYVRDLLLNKSVKDIDIVVLGNGVEFARRVASELSQANLVVYEKFHTAMVHLGDTKIEFVGARKERYERDSRKPIVEEATLEEDLSRRDFTINAIAASINAADFGAIEDPFDGQSDLARRTIRTPLEPDRTFDDDPLRILRAFRFAAQLGFDLQKDLLAAAARMRERLKIVSQERISDEFLKLLASPNPSLGLSMMYETGAMEVVFPEVALLAGTEQRQDYHHKDVLRHTFKVVENISRETDNVWLRMAALLHDIAKPKTKAFKPGVGWTFHGHEEVGARMVKPIFRRMKFPLEYVPYVEKLVRLHLRPMALVDEGVTDSAIRRLLFEAGEDIDDLMTLCRADITSKNPKLVKEVQSNYDHVVQRMREVEERDRMRAWQPPVRGDEIMQLCGLGPGPAVGLLKKEITEAILDGRIPNDHDAAVEYLLKIKDEILSRV
jgi:poly(A) polymerase